MTEHPTTKIPLNYDTWFEPNFKVEPSQLDRIEGKLDSILNLLTTSGGPKDEKGNPQ